MESVSFMLDTAIELGTGVDGETGTTHFQRIAPLGGQVKHILSNLMSSLGRGLGFTSLLVES